MAVDAEARMAAWLIGGLVVLAVLCVGVCAVLDVLDDPHVSLDDDWESL